MSKRQKHHGMDNTGFQKSDFGLPEYHLETNSPPKSSANFDNFTEIALEANGPEPEATSNDDVGQDEHKFFDKIDNYFEESNSSFAKMVRRIKQNSETEEGGKLLRRILSIGVLLLYLGYLIAVIVVHSRIQDEEYWCSGDGFLYLFTLIVGVFLAYFHILKKHVFPSLQRKSFRTPLRVHKISDFWRNRNVRICFAILVAGGVITFYIIDTADERQRLVSFIGLFFLVLFGFVFSFSTRKIVWRPIIWGLSIQFILALLVLRWPLGNEILECLSDKVTEFLGFATEGAIFVFGNLAESPCSIFAFSVLPVTIFFSFCTNILYYFGAIQWVVIRLGWLFKISIGTTLCESMNAAGNIFLGQTESPLLIKPYLPDMTNSEIHSVMTSGFATVAGSVMAAYISLGADASLLITASVMNAPAALAFSKLMYPNLEKSKIDAAAVASLKSPEVNALHAGCVGVTNAIPLVANIAANLIAFISFIAFFNAVFDWSCQLLDYDEGTCSLEGCFGYIFMPLAWMMGVAWEDCRKVGQIIGLKIIVNEFVAYTKLSEFIDGNMLSERSIAITTFAICGFGNISSVGITMGALGALAPERKDDMAKLAFRAMIAGCLATFSSACIAGTLFVSSGEITIANDTSRIPSGAFCNWKNYVPMIINK